jgi:leucyl aminopeptidase
MFFSWLQNANPKTSAKKTGKKSASLEKVSKAHIHILEDSGLTEVPGILESYGQSTDVMKTSEHLHFQIAQGPVWILKLQVPTGGLHDGRLNESAYSKTRDYAGLVVAQLKTLKLQQVYVHFHGTQEMSELGFLTGLEASIYSYKEVLKGQPELLSSSLFVQKNSKPLDLEILNRAKNRAASISLARHLVNLPPNLKRPSQIVSLVKKLKLSGSSKITAWNSQKLKTEKCELLLATGQGSDDPPQLLKISYRPKVKSARKPVAIVGKGITFDTGGLDIKPSSAMRLMKKDMGGAASVIAIALWVDRSKFEHPVDFYLALAENAIDGKSMRPSDVYRSRNGLTVEIDNTDAEGRLVLADALDVAVTDSSKPEVVIDLATLTGACRVALGLEVAGLFSNDDELADEINKSAQLAGDLNWRLPLVDRYFSTYSSPFADFKNAGESFGGAITAALFLQKFVRSTKWAHLDMYSWTDRPNGIFHGAGGNAQCVQALIHWLEGR